MIFARKTITIELVNLKQKIEQGKGGNFRYCQIMTGVIYGMIVDNSKESDECIGVTDEECRFITTDRRIKI